MKFGTEDRKKVAIFASLLGVIVLVAIWQFHSLFGGSAASQPMTSAPRPVAGAARTGTGTGGAKPDGLNNSMGNEAQRFSITSNIDPTLHLAKLAQAEDVEYRGTGRNIFSAESAPVRIEQPIRPARTQPVQIVSTPAAPPQAPPIDLKYFGYSQTRDKSMNAFLMHGDDIFMAKSGEVVDHRYKVNSISPGSVQITDLAYNNTQTLPLAPN